MNTNPAEHWATYQRLFQNAAFAIVGTDGEGRVVTWNPAAERLFHCSPEAAAGRPLAEVVAVTDGGALNKAVGEALSDGRKYEFEVDYEQEDGAGRTFALELAPLRDESGPCRGLALWGRDVTRQKALERQLVQAEKMASLGTLAAGVAHHFNNIMGGIATFVDYALTSDNPDLQHRALQMTSEAANRVGEITTSLLTFAERDRREFDLVDLTEVVLTFSQLVEKLLGEKHIKLELHLRAVPVLEVPGSRMHQVLGNLLDNAENSMPDGGTVWINLYREGNDAVVQFSDTGQGIESKDVPRIFEPFFTTRGTLGGGNKASAGLGLSVVHGIVGELGGTIGVTSKVGQGTTFTIHLPFHRKPARDADEPS